MKKLQIITALLLPVFVFVRCMKDDVSANFKALPLTINAPADNLQGQRELPGPEGRRPGERHLQQSPWSRAAGTGDLRGE